MRTNEEFLEILNRVANPKHDMFDEIWIWRGQGDDKELGIWKKVERKGGREGEGEEVYVVLHFPKDQKYVRIDGNYYSYDGIHFEHSEWRIVTPKEKTITVYE